MSGRQIGPYVLRYEIASGGMGEVYLAQMRGPAGVERWVALKVLKPDMARQTRFVTMFLDEARIASRLSHPNLCAVVDFGVSENRYYLALEYLHGETLSRLVRRVHLEAASGTAAVPYALLARILSDAARGLHAAHEARGPDGRPLCVVHRDVSPQNVFVLYDGAAKIMDFGIATATGKESHTVTGEVKGKFAYMSPEQLSGKAVDRRTDVFALGTVLWESMVGRRLFRAESEGETVLNVMSKPVPVPSGVVQGIPPQLDRIVLRALERDLAKRYATAGDMADDIDEYLASLGRPTGPAKVGGLMKQLFADQIRTRDAMLRARMPPVGIIPELDSQSGSSIRTVSPLIGNERTLLAPATRRLRWTLAGLGVLLVVGVAGVVALAPWADPPRPPITGVPTAPAPVAPPAPEPEPATPPAPPPVPVAETDEPAPPAGQNAATKRTPAPTGTGTLNLIATPGSAHVYLRGTKIGTTPLFQKRLPAGRHALRLVPVDGGPAQRVTVDIRPGQLTPVSVRLEH